MSLRLAGRSVTTPSGEQWQVILLGFAVAAGILARGLLGRPWVVHARRSDGAENALSWGVVGLARSGRVIDEVALALGNGLRPSPAEVTEAVASESRPRA